MKKILVLCTGNSCRSQMAHGYLSSMLAGKAEVFSAGIETHGVNPRAVSIMMNDGIDISHHTSNHVDQYRHIQFDYIITVCDSANENCPFLPGKAVRLHQNFADPAKATGTNDEIMNEFARVRDQIKLFCIDFTRTYFQ